MLMVVVAVFKSRRHSILEIKAAWELIVSPILSIA